MEKYNAGIGTPYWYEWEIGLLKCLDMLYDDTIEGVAFQSSDYQSLDDVVVFYKDKCTVNIQVKHTDIDKNFTCSTLLSGEESMLQSWANDWVKNKYKNNITEIKIISNKKYGPNATEKYCSFVDFVQRVLPMLKRDYNYIFGSEKENNIAIEIKSQLSKLGNDAVEFIKLLNFESEGDIDELDKKIYDKIEIILGIEDKNKIEEKCLLLFGKLQEWTTSQRAKEIVYKEDIYKILCEYSTPVKYKHNPELPIFPSRIRFAKNFINTINECEQKMIFLQGLPGSGKTNFISYLANSFPEYVHFRFYTYLPITLSTTFFNNDSGYFSGKFLWTAILFQLKEKFEELNVLSKYNFPLVYDYLDDTELKKLVLKYLDIYVLETNKICNIFIDGIDHAARYSGTTFLNELPMPNEIPNNIKFILVGQPLYDMYPSWIQNNDEVLKISLPSLEEDDVTMLIDKYKITINNAKIETLSKNIIDLVGNNALNIIFAIYECTKISTNNYDEFINHLKEKNLCNTITKYYEWIIGAFEINDLLVLKVLALFAFTTKKLTIEEIFKSCDTNYEAVVYTLNKLFPLIQEDNSEYYTFHNDVKIFLKDYIVHNSNFHTISNSLKKQILTNNELFILKYYFLFDMLIESRQTLETVDLFNVEYIVKSLSYQVPFILLYKQLEKLFSNIKNSEDFNLINKFSLSLASLSQYYGCIRWNDKEKELIENDECLEHTFSETYVIELPKDFEKLINDIYCLCIHNIKERAQRLYDEHLSKLGLKSIVDYLNSFDESTAHDLAEKYGFLCRFFNIKLFDEQLDENLFYSIFKGWMNASIGHFSIDELKITFSFKFFNTKILCEYFNNINELNNKHSFQFLVDFCLKSKNVPFSCLINLCVLGIINNYESKELILFLSQHYKNILTCNELDFYHDKIEYFFKLMFCIYQDKYLEQSDEFKKIYKEILSLSYINEKDRGFAPAMEQFRLCEQSIDNFYAKNYKIDKDIETSYCMGFIDKRFGAGSINDSNSIKVRNFIFAIIYNNLILKDDQIVSDFCKRILSIYIDKENRFFDCFIPLFCKVNMENEFMQIYNAWAGNNGFIWKESFSDTDYIFSSIAGGLKKFNKVNEYEELSIRRNLRFLSYIGHKDCSLCETLSLFECMDISPSIFSNQCIKLLRISDYASDIGDNRIGISIDKFIVQSAVKLGPKFVYALYELKNDKYNFYNWRRYLLEAYIKKINQDLFCSDKEICSFLDIYNAWTKIEIEKVDRFEGNTKANQLKANNYMLIQKIKDEDLRSTYSSKYPNELVKDTIEEENNLILHNNKVENDVMDKLLNDIKLNGLTDVELKNIKNNLENLNYHAAGFLERIADVISEQSKKLVVDEIIIEYILDNFEYGFRSNGSNRLISKYGMYIDEKDYLKLINILFDKAFKKGYDYLYSVSEDMETLILNYYLHYEPNNLIDLADDRLNMHEAWITGAGSLEFKNYSLSFDDSIKDLCSLRDKILKREY